MRRFLDVQRLPLNRDRSLVNIALKSRVFDPKVAKRVDADLLAYRCDVLSCFAIPTV